jgi:hypothetical protein
MLAAIDAYFSASDGTEEEVAENLLLDVRDEINKQQSKAQPAPVQEPLPQCTHNWVSNPKEKWCLRCGAQKADHIAGGGKMMPPAPQPVPVKTYHDFKPWPVAPMPWVGLSEEEINKLRHLVDWTAEWSYDRFAYHLERLLREKNGGAA